MGDIHNARVALSRGTEALEEAPIPTIESMLKDLGEGFQDSLDPLKQRLVQLIEAMPALARESNKAERDAAKGRMSYLAAVDNVSEQDIVKHAFACHDALTKVEGRTGMMGDVAVRALGILADLNRELEMLEMFKQRSLTDIQTAQEERQLAIDCVSELEL